MVSAIVGVLVGGIGAVGMAYAANTGDIAVALVSGVASGVGGLVIGAALLPSAIHVIGRSIAWTSAAAQLATANATRNRTRTAATGTALLIGTILLAMLTTGVTSVRDSIVTQIDDRRPFDLIVRTADGQAISNDLVDAVRATDGIEADAPVTIGTIEVVATDGSQHNLIAEGIDPQATQSIAHSDVAVPDNGTIQVHPGTLSGISNGDRIAARGTAGKAELTVTLNPHVVAGQAIMTSEDLNRLTDDVAISQLQLQLVPNMNAEDVQQVMTDILSLSDRLGVAGGAQERVYYSQILDTLLAVLLALLAVAVVIAFVGIGNTAALSVIERRRESALLRAVGLSRRQLIGMICIEAALTAAVATLFGLVVGVLFGWAGITTLAKSAPEIEMMLHVPWGQLTPILFGATLAGIIAAILPAYTASKRKPVQDLAAS